MPKAIAQPAQSATTRDRLLAAAAEAIASVGWGSVTTRQVAALAGVNQALVHYHFGSMEALRREAALQALVAETSEPTLAILEAPTVTEGVVACLEALEQFGPRSPRALVLYEAMLASARDDELAAMLQRALGLFREVLAARIAEEGGADPEGSAAALAAVLDGLLLHRLVDRSLSVTALGPAIVAGLQLPKRRRS